MNCSKCRGTGHYLHYGTCWSCGGTGKKDNGTKKVKFKVGDKIVKNNDPRKKVFEIVKVTRRNYECDCKTKLGRHIDNYPQDSKEGYKIIN